MTSGLPLLEVDNVSARFGGIRALRGISLRVEYGEALGVIGPNGSGKTTLLDCVAGIVRPAGGSIRFQGKAIDAAPAFRRARVGIRRTFQSTALFDALTVTDNVLIGADQPRSPRRRPSHYAAKHFIEAMGLAAYADAPARTLSTGYRKRVEIARALAGEPNLLLLDEPTAGIQPADAAEIMTSLDQLRAELGMGVLLVEHNIPVVLAHSDRVVAFDCGEVIADGPPNVVREDPKVQQSYLGSSVT